MDHLLSKDDPSGTRIRVDLSDRLGTHRGMSVSGLACPLAGLRRLRFSFFSDEPTLFPRSLEHPFVPPVIRDIAGNERVLWACSSVG